MSLEHLALSRATLDRAAHRRTEPDLLDLTSGADGTLDRARVLLLDGDRAPVRDAGDGVELVLIDAVRAPAGLLEPQRLIFLGEDGDGRAHVAVRGTGADLPPSATAQRWAGLREVGAVLDDTGAGVLTTAVALANWHATHGRCARCGSPTDVVQAGWARQCPACGAEHYPRTDPAVIMSVVDGADRILLGHQAAWPPRRFSTLAGFVEPGESLEAAVRREVLEESAVVVGDVHYQGSQPWPFPSSLMLGFRAEAITTELQPDGHELADARWWSRQQLADDVASGELLLPPRVSIARRLIEQWFGDQIEAEEAWR